MPESKEQRPGPIAVAIAGDTNGPVRTERFRLTGEARGPWSNDAAHGGAPAALLARCAGQFGADADLRLAGFSTTFNGPVPLGEIAIEAELVKPGRRQRIVALRLLAGGRLRMEARAVLLRRGAVELPPPGPVAGSGGGMGEPGQGREVDQTRWAWDDGPAFHRTANTVRAVEGGPDRTGETGSAWFRLEAPLIGADPARPAERAVAAADFGNGVAHPVPFGEYLFVNCDLNVSLFREPVGEWIGIAARSIFDPGGAGVTTTRIFDGQGEVGSAAQTLFVDRV